MASSGVIAHSSNDTGFSNCNLLNSLLVFESHSDERLIVTLRALFPADESTGILNLRRGQASVTGIRILRDSSASFGLDISSVCSNLEFYVRELPRV